MNQHLTLTEGKHRSFFSTGKSVTAKKLYSIGSRRDCWERRTPKKRRGGSSRRRKPFSLERNLTLFHFPDSGRRRRTTSEIPGEREAPFPGLECAPIYPEFLLAGNGIDFLSTWQRFAAARRRSCSSTSGGSKPDPDIIKPFSAIIYDTKRNGQLVKG